MFLFKKMIFYKIIINSFLGGAKTMTWIKTLDESLVEECFINTCLLILLRTIFDINESLPSPWP